MRVHIQTLRQLTIVLACSVAFSSVVRAAEVQPYHIDLAPHANHLLDEDFLPAHYTGDRLSEVEKGEQYLAGTSFRIGDSLIEVSGKFVPDNPARVDDIRVDRYVKSIRILQGARWGAYGKKGDSLGHWVADGTPIGYYEVNFADADSVAIPIVYGVDVRDWWSVWDDSKPTDRGVVAWTGSNPHLRTRSEARHTEDPLRLYMTTWENPNPESRVTSISFVSLNQIATPFCVAMTANAIPGVYNTQVDDLESRIEQLQDDIDELKQLIGRNQVSTAGFFDDFNGQHDQIWQILNHNPDNVSLTRRRGMLTITTEQGGIWKSFDGTKNIFLIDNPVTDGDFVITTQIDGFDPVANYNQAGLICLDDTDNYLKFVLQWDRNQGGKAVSCLREIAGSEVHSQFVPAQDAPDKIWLRLIKKGDRMIAIASRDGERYHLIAQQPWGQDQPAMVGLIAKNGAPGSAPQLDASFDSFDISPLAPGQYDRLMRDVSQVKPSSF